MNTIRCASVSGGKDSTATAIIMLDEHPHDECRMVFADTGNEQQQTLDYMHDYLPNALGMEIVTVRADFKAHIAHKRELVQTKWRKEGIPESKIERALAVLHPTGNPYLDLCLMKGRFPSRLAQFCTQELKTIPIAEYQAQFMEQGFHVESWQGVRRDESKARENCTMREWVDDTYSIFRPIVYWTAQQTVDFSQTRGIELNPLYSQGMNRVGCMPCINCQKDELLEISKRFPEEIERIAEWEMLVGEAGKRDVEGQTFFAVKGAKNEEAHRIGNIREKVKWAATTRGGKQFDLLQYGTSPTCQSAYGLCE